MAQINLEAPALKRTQQRGSGRFRQLSYLALLAGLVVLTILIAWAVFRFSLPKPGSIAVGNVQDFQTGHEPRLFWLENTPFYVVKSGDEIIALSPFSVSGRKPCFVKWDPDRSLFYDPCWGTRIDVYGKYQGGGPPAELTRLPVHVVDGEIWVDVWSP